MEWCGWCFLLFHESLPIVRSYLGCIPTCLFGVVIISLSTATREKEVQVWLSLSELFYQLLFIIVAYGKSYRWLERQQRYSFLIRVLCYYSNPRVLREDSQLQVAKSFICRHSLYYPMKKMTTR